MLLCCPYDTECLRCRRYRANTTALLQVTCPGILETRPIHRGRAETIPSMLSYPSIPIPSAKHWIALCINVTSSSSAQSRASSKLQKTRGCSSKSLSSCICLMVLKRPLWCYSTSKASETASLEVVLVGEGGGNLDSSLTSRSRFEGRGVWSWPACMP